MVKGYKKGQKVRLSSNFNSIEFDCQCIYRTCKETLIDEALIIGLEAMRLLSGPIEILSGFRCMDHNADIGGAETSQHMLGKAADCKSISGYKGNLMAQYAEEVPVFKKGGIGIYPNFAHVDTRKGPARWSFPLGC